jgi:hypothetical protein
MQAYLTLIKGKPAWSGYLAQGDPAHRPWRAVVDVGRDFFLSEDGKLYFAGSGKHVFIDWTPSAVLMASRYRMFGMRLIEEDELGAIARDREERRRTRLGRRGRIKEDLESTED